MNTLLLAAFAWLAPTLAPALAPAVAPAPAPADELRRDRVPADVDLLVHFDFEGFKQTQLFKHALAIFESDASDTDLRDLREFGDRFGIDPLKDVRAVTLFKLESEEEPTVMLFSTTAAVDGALKKFQAEPGYARIQEGALELHTWSEGDGDDVFAYLHAGAGDERAVVIAGNRASAIHAARVLRGEDVSHARGGAALALAPAHGSFLYVAAKGLPQFDGDDTPASRVFGLAQGIQVDLGEAGGFLRAHAGVATSSPADALDISNVVNGLISLARLAGAELGDAIEVLSGVRLTTRGSEVLFDFEFEVERLFEIVQQLEELEGRHDGDHDEDDEGQEQVQEREGGRRIK